MVIKNKGEWQVLPNEDMNIAIFEDNDDDYKVLKERIECFFKYADMENIDYFIKRYSNQEDIFNDIYEIDLIFLDIEFNKVSLGIDIGIKIREMKNDIFIIFISNYSQYLMEGYKAHANRYLLKPISQACFNVELKSVLKKYLFNYAYIYDPKICLSKIYFSQIIYVDFVNRKSNIHLRNGKTIRTNYQFKDWIELLPEICFGQIYRSIIVNYNYITGVNNQEVSLSNNVVLPLSKLHKEHFNESYAKFIHWRI